LLKTRILTALVLATLVVAGLFYLPPGLTGLILGTFLVAGAWECSRLFGWTRVGARVCYALAIALAALAVWRWNESSGVFAPLLIAGLLWWAAAAGFVVAAQRQRLGRGIALASNPLVGGVVLLPAWSAIVWLMHNDPAMLLVLFLLIWTADAAAYFVGKRWGRRRLALHVSPGKTWEGVAGGLVFGGAVAIGATLWMVFSTSAQIGFIVTGLFTIVASVVGDLFVSMLKRRAGLKDSGRILPGHGGVMDRIDGLVAAAPVFSAGLYFWVSRL
jgi:phosphatidate cytidylyltransferase